MCEDFLAGIKLADRSALYSMPIIGHSGRDQEALLDYAHRLAQAHCVKVRELFSRVIFPEVDQFLCLKVGNFGQKYLRTCNGTTKYALALLNSLEKLTGRNDLSNGTMIPWRQFFDPKGYTLLSPYRRWCPECVAEHRREGIIHHHLAWMIAATSLCPIHYTPLQMHCAECGRTQLAIHDSICVARCYYCNEKFESIRSSTPMRLSDSPRERYMADAVVELIDANQWANEFARPALTKISIQAAADALTNGKIRLLELAIKLPDGTLRNEGGKSFCLFLEICYRLGLKPLEFLNLTKLPAPIKKEELGTYHTVVRRKVILDDGLRHSVSKTLQKLLSDNNNLTTKRDFCESIGITPTFFRYHFPQELEKLQEHNKYIRKALAKKNSDDAWRRAESALLLLIDTKLPPTSRRIKAALLNARFPWRMNGELYKKVKCLYESLLKTTENEIR